MLPTINPGLTPEWFPPTKSIKRIKITTSTELQFQLSLMIESVISSNRTLEVNEQKDLQMCGGLCTIAHRHYTFVCMSYDSKMIGLQLFICFCKEDGVWVYFVLPVMLDVRIDWSVSWKKENLSSGYAFVETKELISGFLWNCGPFPVSPYFATVKVDGLTLQNIVKPKKAPTCSEPSVLLYDLIRNLPQSDKWPISNFQSLQKALGLVRSMRCQLAWTTIKRREGSHAYTNVQSFIGVESNLVTDGETTIVLMQADTRGAEEERDCVILAIFMGAVQGNRGSTPNQPVISIRIQDRSNKPFSTTMFLNWDVMVPGLQLDEKVTILAAAHVPAATFRQNATEWILPLLNMVEKSNKDVKVFEPIMPCALQMHISTLARLVQQVQAQQHEDGTTLEVVESLPLQLVRANATSATSQIKTKVLLAGASTLLAAHVYNEAKRNRMSSFARFVGRNPKWGYGAHRFAFGNL